MAKRQKVEGYPGVYYRLADRIGRKGRERVYYVVYKRDGKVIEAKAGKQFADAMTPARAALFRARLIEGKEQTRQERREAAKEAQQAEAIRWTINRLWDSYVEINAGQKSLNNERIKFEKVIRPDIGKKEPRELVPLDVDRIRMDYQKQGKRTMAARVIELLRRTINFGVKRGLIGPLKFKIEVPRLNNQTTEDLTPTQLARLIEIMDQAPDQTAANIMRLVLATGMRKSEILKLRWEDIDHRRGFLTIRDPKGGMDQTIPMNDPAKAVFESIKNDSEFVFPGRFGGPLTGSRGVADIAKAAGLPVGFRPLHGLRHVYASTLASSRQVDMHVLQRLLTHKDPRMTQRYAHLRDEVLKQAADVVGEIVSSITADKSKDQKVIKMTNDK